MINKPPIPSKFPIIPISPIILNTPIPPKPSTTK